MRKILKALSLVMVLVMCFTMVFTTAVSAEGTDTLVLSVDNAAPKAGETVNITVTSNFTTVAGAHFAIDLAGLEYVSVAGDYAEYFSAETMNFVKEFNEDNGNLVESGVLFVITATVPADAEAGTVYNVGFGTIATNKEFCDYNENEVVVTKTGVDVTVAADEPEVPECEHVEGDFVKATPVIGGKEGSITFTCATCGEEFTQDVISRAYSILDTPQIGCTSKTELIFRTPSVAVNGSTAGIFTYTQTYVSGNTNVVALPVSDEYKTKYGYEWPTAVPYSGFTEEYDTALYLKVDGAWTNGGNSVRSVKGLIMDNMIKAASVDEETKKIAANLLYAGARTQEGFNYGLDNLADVDLVGDYAAYVTADMPTLEKTPGVNYTNFPTDYKGKALFDTPAIVLGDAVAIRHTVRLNFYSGNKDDIKLKYEYTSFDGAVKSDYLVVEPQDANTYVFELGVDAPDMRSIINFTIYNGDTAIGDVSPYSVEAVMKHTYDSGNYVDIINAVMNYSDAALEKFS